MVLLAGGLAWYVFDLLEYRLREADVRFEVGTRRFDDYRLAHAAAREATLAVRRELAVAGPAPRTEPGTDADTDTDTDTPAARAAAVRRLERTATTLQEAVAGMGLSWLAPWSRAVQGVAADLRRAEAPADGAARGPARARAYAGTREVLDDLARLDLEVRGHGLPASLPAQVDGVRQQALLAFALLVLMLVLVAALAAQWGRVARRERAVRRRAEQLAEVAETERARAEAVARDKARFLGMLSHELLTPLQSIWSSMDLIESRGRIDLRDPAFIRLKDSTRMLRGRISDLVDFARMSAGRLETRIRGFQPDKLVDTALRDAEEALAAKNLDVHWEPGPELARRVWSDPARLRQVLDNLLSNAIKYTERGGISLHAAICAEAGELRLEVSDTGVGIEPERLARLFDPFYRAPETAAMAEGSGLGLAVVRSLVDLMGGRIEVASRPGQGTSVVVAVPIADGGEADVDPPWHLAVAARRPVLVVDDSRDARGALAEVIRATGLDVFEADGGAAGLAEAAQRDYLAIILDLQMPDLGGAEVARRLRADGSRQRRTFLVLVSAAGDPSAAAGAALFDARIDKPASRRDLVRVLARAAATLASASASAA